MTSGSDRDDVLDGGVASTVGVVEEGRRAARADDESKDHAPGGLRSECTSGGGDPAIGVAAQFVSALSGEGGGRAARLSMQWQRRRAPAERIFG